MSEFLCQYKCVPDLGQETPFRVILIERLREICSQLKRKYKLLKQNLVPGVQSIDKTITITNSKNPDILTGDTVRVLPQEQIRNMLDYRGIYKGLPIIEEQYACCGNSYKVFKEVKYFYDERKNKLCKCNDMVLLEGSFCSGKQKLYSESCDLNCYFFWHKDWLEKI